MYSAMSSEPHLQSTLLVLCGDHGMNEAGNHGGSTPGETSPALLFIAPKFKSISKGRSCPSDEPDRQYKYYTTVEQSDVVPTLAGLLGFAVPLNNLGVFIPDLLEFWPTSTYLDSCRSWIKLTNPVDENVALLKANADQILIILRQAYRNTLFDEEPSENLCTMPENDAILLHCKWAIAKRGFETKAPGASQNLLEVVPQLVKLFKH